MPAPALITFPGISSRAYEHPADRTALTALRKLEGFDTVLRKLAGMFNERSLRLLHLATGVRASEAQFAHLHAMVSDACRVLDMPVAPDIFVTQSPIVSAMAIGIDKPWLVVSSGALDLFDADELRFIVGHEVGHVLSGHAVYRTMLFTLMRWSTRVAWFPIGAIGIRAVVVALEEWFRKSELSCDRAGLLCGQDVGAALRAHMKLAGGSRWHDMDTAAFLDQAREYESAGDVRDGVAKLMHLIGQSHPMAALRAAELQSWASGGEYARILAGDYPRRVDDATTSVTDEARNAAKSYRDKVTESADPLMGLVKDLGGAAAGAFDKLRRMATTPSGPSTPGPSAPPNGSSPSGGSAGPE
jgi:Zn-dependent protease with chaperone function